MWKRLMILSVLGVTLSNLFGQDNRTETTVATYLEKASEYEINNQYTDALDLYTKAIMLQPSNAELYDKRGIVYFKMQKYQKALNNLNIAILIDSSKCELYNHRGVIYYYMQISDKALDDYNKALVLDPLFAKAYYNRGIVKLFIEDEYGAMNDLRVAADLNFKDAIELLSKNIYASN